MLVITVWIDTIPKLHEIVPRGDENAPDVTDAISPTSDQPTTELPKLNNIAH